LLYTRDHEWLRVDDRVGTVGLSTFGANSLGEIAAVYLPQVSRIYGLGEQAGTIQATKAISDLFMPVSGEVIATNDAVNANPGLVNSDPLGQGWLYKILVVDPNDLGKLMSEADYQKYLKTQ
jgi:glycine cleavage system H protein